MIAAKLAGLLIAPDQRNKVTRSSFAKRSTIGMVLPRTPQLMALGAARRHVTTRSKSAPSKLDQYAALVQPCPIAPLACDVTPDSAASTSALKQSQTKPMPSAKLPIPMTLVHRSKADTA